MGLIGQYGRYIKLNIDGTYQGYQSEEDRLKEKNATPKDLILATYQNIIDEIWAQSESRYYNPEKFSIIYKAWLDEYTAYVNDVTLRTHCGNYPLMATIYPDISDSVPEIIVSGIIAPPEIPSIQLKDVYAKAKDHGYWGSEEEVRDA